MIKVVVVDDELLSLEYTQHLLRECNFINVVGLYQKPLLALEKIRDLSPDVLISDISMPEIDGIQFAQRALDILPNMRVVFMTAYDSFALKAFEIGAFDYIMKPVSKDRLQSLILRISRDFATKKDSQANNVHPENKMKNFISISKSDSIVVINKAEIMYCCANNKKTYVYIQDGCYECRYTLEQLENVLDKETFLRCHRSYIVNLQYIREISPMFNQTYIIKLKNSRAEIPVSRNYAVRMKDLLSL